MNFTEAQEDMRTSYFGGGPGVFASGIVWFASGVTAWLTTEKTGVLVFFFGGMFIHPLGILLSKLLKRSGQHKKGNPLSVLALESTLLLFIGLFIAYSIMYIRPNWFFPVMMLIIGGRYFLFSSIYGMRFYWLLGSILALSGALGFFFNSSFYLFGLVGGALEILFSFVLISLEKKGMKTK
ncbi:DUF7010 family protein [Allomuricauda sp. R78024]|uniref:DUF7010 family protein n=1 Tax=Allomuricauda sp. R78024 TaxID=3093867 RepID=UPI0037CB00BB